MRMRTVKKRAICPKCRSWHGIGVYITLRTGRTVNRWAACYQCGAYHPVYGRGFRNELPEEQTDAD